jgi:hypothetical protein
LKLSKLFQKLFFHQKALLKFESLITNIWYDLKVQPNIELKLMCNLIIKLI